MIYFSADSSYTVDELNALLFAIDKGKQTITCDKPCECCKYYNACMDLTLVKYNIRIALDKALKDRKEKLGIKR